MEPALVGRDRRADQLRFGSAAEWFALDRRDHQAIGSAIAAGDATLRASGLDHAVSPFLYEWGAGELLVHTANHYPLGPPAGDRLFRSCWSLPYPDDPSALATSGTPRVFLATSKRSAPLSLVDVIAAGATSLIGAPSVVEETLATGLFTLVPARPERPIVLIAIGMHLGALEGFAIEHLDSLAQLIDPRREDPQRVPGSTTITLVGEEAAKDHERIARLIEVTERSAGHGVICLGAPFAAKVIISLETDVAAAICVPVSGQVAAIGPLRSFDPPKRPAGGGPEPGDPLAVEISILGAVEIRNASGSLVNRPKLTELVVYLAMHPEGATTPTWSTALWPTRRVPPQTVANRLSEARRELGFASDEKPRLRKFGERFLLHEVVTDWEDFQALAAPREAPASWRAALALIRGRPFEGLHQDQWATLEGFVAAIEQAIVACALRYGEHALEAGDPQEASWAAQAGLRANPFDERLHRLLMRAADAAGNRAGIEHVLRHLALVMEIDGDPLAGVHPETAALYERLIGS